MYGAEWSSELQTQLGTVSVPLFLNSSHKGYIEKAWQEAGISLPAAIKLSWWAIIQARGLAENVLEERRQIHLWHFYISIITWCCSVVFGYNVVLFTCNEYMYYHSWGIDIAEQKGRASSPGFSSELYSTSKMSWVWLNGTGIQY